MLFVRILNMSISASYVIAIVILLRLMLCKLPKKYSHVLWLFVALRLIIPVSIPWNLSIFNLDMFSGISSPKGTQEFIPSDIEYFSKPEINTGISSVNTAVNGILPPATPNNSANPLQIWLAAGELIWFFGIAALAIYELVMLIRTKCLVRQAVLLRENIYECDNLPSPFVMGIIKPKIYIPFRLEEKELEYILCHEKHHIKRLDHIFKPLATALCTVYWFNPLVWVAYFLFISDMEMSCDEWVITKTGRDTAGDYSSSLLAFALNKRHLPLGPLAFGESSAGRRIKNIMSFKKPKLWISLLCTIFIIGTGAVCLTNGSQTADIKTRLTAEAWARAICERNARGILMLASDECIRDMAKSDKLLFDPDTPSMGWSSPWPWGEENGSFVPYRIVSIDNHSAEILYYAMVSDPHIYVWRESLEFAKSEDKVIVTSESMEFLDNITKAEEFYRAYPDGVIGPSMDYTENNLGEYLSRNAKEHPEFYGDLSSPESAALYLLNIDPDSVSVTSRETKFGCQVEITFKYDNTKVYINMGRYGNIWIPMFNSP